MSNRPLLILAYPRAVLTIAPLRPGPVGRRISKIGLYPLIDERRRRVWPTTPIGPLRARAQTGAVPQRLGRHDDPPNLPQVFGGCDRIQSEGKRHHVDPRLLA